MTRLVVATRNPGKVRELRALLSSLALEVVPADGLPEVEETGATFAENAERKARAAAEWSGEWSLADDSGLEVDALGGGPGVHSNRFAGESTTEADRNAKLLELLQDVPPEHRTARYRAAVAVAAPDGRVWLTEGACEGVILQAPRGEGGFGYDPLFLLPQLGKTMAELEPEAKNRLSHRGRAMAEAMPILERLAGGG
jgi:XTP/dITP diphosphohydrolase